MPELPEVETIRRQLQPALADREVLEADSHWSAKFLPAREAVGRTLGPCGRRGKYLLLPLDNGKELVIHLGMTGVLSLLEDGLGGKSSDRDETYCRAWWLLDNGQRLVFDDVRRFGRIRVVTAGDYSDIPTLRTAGPEPFDEALTATTFWESLKASKRSVKTQLLSQRPVVGVGNIYADEALWIAQINPKTTRVGFERASLLLDAIRDVLDKGIENGGTTLRDYRKADGSTGNNQTSLVAYGRSGQPCLRCNETLRSFVLDGRTTTYCAHCQRK